MNVISIKGKQYYYSIGNVTFYDHEDVNPKDKKNQ